MEQKKESWKNNQYIFLFLCAKKKKKQGSEKKIERWWQGWIEQISCPQKLPSHLGDGFQKLILIRHMLHCPSVPQPKCQIGPIDISLCKILKKIHFKKLFSWITFLGNIKSPKIQIRVVQDSLLKLLAKSHQNPKSVNKVIVQLMLNFKSLLFSLWRNWWHQPLYMTLNIVLKLCEKVQLKQLILHEIIVLNV